MSLIWEYWTSQSVPLDKGQFSEKQTDECLYFEAEEAHPQWSIQKFDKLDFSYTYMLILTWDHYLRIGPLLFNMTISIFPLGKPSIKKKRNFVNKIHKRGGAGVTEFIKPIFFLQKLKMHYYELLIAFSRFKGGFQGSGGALWIFLSP